MYIKRAFAPLTIQIETKEELDAIRQMAYYFQKQYQDRKWFGMRSQMEDGTLLLAERFLREFK